MDKIRIYFMPKGYKDIICNQVIVDGKNYTGEIIGGKEDGIIYQRCYGAKVIKFNVEVEEE